MNSSLPRALALLSLAILTGLTSPAAGQTASLVKDIHPGSAALGSFPDEMWTFRGKVLFAASEPSSGRELWITDGNGSGTRMLADFFSGVNSSNPRILGTAGSLLFGIAFDDEICCGASAFLWRSDGTREGTFLLPDPHFRVAIPFDDNVDPGDAPVPVALAADGAYFTGCEVEETCGVWRTDGTQEGTRVLRSFAGSVFGGAPSGLTLAGGRLFFATSQQLWTSDGTAAGTVLVHEFPFSLPHRLAALGNKVLFLARAAAPATGEELWVSDGTSAGTRALTSFEVDRPFEQTNFLKALGDKIYFVADDATHGAEIWASDGTPAGTGRVTDFGFHDPFRGPENSVEEGLVAPAIDKLGNRLIFWANDGLTGFKPWSSQGTFQSTSPVCPTCSFSDQSVQFVKLGGKLLFHAEETEEGKGAELWTTDGTANGTKLLKDVCPGFCSGVQSDLALLPGAVAFRGPGIESHVQTLWTSDGTPQGTRRFPTAELPISSSPVAAAILGRNILFSANRVGEDLFGNPQELWVSDGTPAGTRQVSAVGQAGASADIAQSVNVGDRVFFTASEDGNIRNVWRSAGTAVDTLKSPEPLFSSFDENSQLAAAGGEVFFTYPQRKQLWRVGDDGQTQQLTNLPVIQNILSLAAYNGKLYFVVSRSSDSASELWESDGTPQGTSRAVDLPTLESVGFLKVVGSELWFLAHDSSHGAEVWRTNGTPSGTFQVHDFGFRPLFTDPEFTKLGSVVYFLARHQIWKADGSPGGTALVAEFPSFNSTEAVPAELTVFQGNLYFFASQPTGRALWRSDGTSLGTLRVRDFSLPPSFFRDTAPRYGLTVLGGRLVFAAPDGAHGREPWTSDGTAAGTTLLRDVFPGPAGSEPSRFSEAAGQLYFSATDGAHGFELWRTDGTTQGTRLVQDIAPEGASSYPAGFTLAGNRLFFSADDGVTGNEMWALPLAGPPCQPSATALCLNAGRFKVEAFWRIPDELSPGQSGRGQAVPLSADTGYFWFFDPANVEAILKVLDGRGANNHFWVFYGALSNVEYSLTVTDTQTGLAHRYFNPQGQFASVGDTQAFGPQGVHETNLAANAGTRLIVSERVAATASTGTCIPGASRLCLSGGRFAVEASWKDFSGRTGTGTAVALSGDTGYFWFFDAANVEAVLKVLDATAVNGHFWVFYGALSNVEYSLTVTDTLTGRVKTYRNPPGRFASAGDTAAF